jgi:O-antigen/teichoic acid export membrane protein
LVVLTATGAVLTHLLVALSLQQALLRVNVVSAVVMLMAGTLFIPSYGLVGAAAALVVGLLSGQLTMTAMPATRTASRVVLMGLIQPLAVGLLCAVSAMTLATSSLSGVGLFLVVYPVGIFLTRTVTSSDVALWRASRDSADGR